MGARARSSLALLTIFDEISHPCRGSYTNTRLAVAQEFDLLLNLDMLRKLFHIDDGSRG